MTCPFSTGLGVRPQPPPLVIDFEHDVLRLPTIH
jgi:hypothetical protein